MSVQLDQHERRQGTRCVFHRTEAKNPPPPCEPDGQGREAACEPLTRRRRQPESAAIRLLAPRAPCRRFASMRPRLSRGGCCSPSLTLLSRAEAASSSAGLSAGATT